MLENDLGPRTKDLDRKQQIDTPYLVTVVVMTLEFD